MYLHALPPDLQELALGYIIVRNRKAERAEKAKLQAQFEALRAMARPA